MDQKKLLATLTPPTGARTTDEGFSGKQGKTSWAMEIAGTPEKIGITLRLKTKSKENLRLSREQGGSLARAIGLSKKITTGDEEFDAIINIVSGDARIGPAFVSVISRRDAAIRLFKNHPSLNRVVFLPASVTFEFTGMPTATIRFEDILTDACAVADGLKDLPRTAIGWGPFIVIASAFALVGIGYVLANGYPRLAWSNGHVWSLILPWGGVALLLFTLIAVFVERGSAKAGAHLAIELTVATIGIFVIADSASRIINIEFDHALPTRYEAIVVGAERHSGSTRNTRKSYALKVEVPSLENRALTLPCRKSLYQSSAMESITRVVRHEGAYGVEWWELQEYERVQK